MGISDLTKRLQSERRDVTVQTSISAADADALDQFVDWLATKGVNSNRSGVLRAMLLDGLEVFKEQLAEERANPNEPPL